MIFFCTFRYLFALQIKKDLASGDLICNDNTAALLSAYAIQAECGDFNPNDYNDHHHYISQFKLISNQDDDFEFKVMENHKKLMYGYNLAKTKINLLTFILYYFTL